jgi:hypothetical protein
MNVKTTIQPSECLEKRTWKEFQETGLIWWVNRSLHLFGWAIVAEIDGQGNILNVYPARCKFRGFSQTIEEWGFKALSGYLQRESSQLLEDSFLTESTNGETSTEETNE